MFDDFPISALRLAGVASGLLCWLIVFLKLRTHARHRVDVWGLFLAGGGLFGLGLFPQSLDGITILFQLKDIKGGRLLTLLMLISAALFFMVLTERARRRQLANTLDRLLNKLSANPVIEVLRALPESTRPQVLVLIPALNEAENLSAVLPRIPKEIAGRRIQALLIDDGSNDGTGETAAAAGALVASHPFNRGGGSALRSGYAVAEALQIKIVVTMDADGQHQPEEMEGLLTPLFKDQADLVIGSRVLGRMDDYSKLRAVGVRVFNTLINLLTGTRITDCASGYRAIRIGALQAVRLRQDQYHTAELIIEAAKHKMRIAEAPIYISARLAGESKKGKSVLYALRFLRTVLRTWLR